ncbi:MAG: GntR family transcriptional regulator [Anaerolineaceae bacterium]|nr:GntR family transcriptional regulator [Anaerolineaceae bacterium]
MDEPFLYQRIAGAIRKEILEGRLQPNDRLPSIRDLTRQWNCTPGTVQRAYHELAQGGLITSQAGRGTHVSRQIDQAQILAHGPLRKAALVHKAEAFLLEVLTSGYSLPEIQQAFTLALDHWRGLQAQPAVQTESALRFYGSHDMAITWLAGHIREIIPDLTLQLVFTGSLGGLFALADGRADVAGAHLWDAATDTYNLPYISRLFPGKHITVTRLAERRLGLIVPPGNPAGIESLKDLTRPALRFVNRQTGSGTRVWLDAQLKQKGISVSEINGYAQEKTTHSEVARTIAEGGADAGIGLESAAAAFNLDFVFLVQECYDLIAYTRDANQPPLLSLFDWLKSSAGHQVISQMQGYLSTNTGTQIEV